MNMNDRTHIQFKIGHWTLDIDYIAEKQYRYLGPRFVYYDGDIYCFGFWFFIITLSDSYHLRDNK